MASKEELVSNFKGEKATAKMYLKLITVENTMTADDLSLVHEQLRLATDSYINMAILLRVRVEALPNSAIAEDDLNDLKADLGEMKSRIRQAIRAIAKANAEPALPPDPETNIMDLCRKLPSAVALHASVPRLPTMMEVNAADKMLSRVETPISGDDVIFDKLKYTALTYNRNTPEMVEDTYAAAEDITASVSAVESEGDWEIFCLEHGIQPAAVDVIFPFVSGTVKKIPRPILLDLSPVSFLDMGNISNLPELPASVLRKRTCSNMPAASEHLSPGQVWKLDERSSSTKLPPGSSLISVPKSTTMDPAIPRPCCTLPGEISLEQLSLGPLSLWKPPWLCLHYLIPWRLTRSSLTSTTDLYSTQDLPLISMLPITMWRPPWCELPEEEHSNGSCISELHINPIITSMASLEEGDNPLAPQLCLALLSGLHLLALPVRLHQPHTFQTNHHTQPLVWVQLQLPHRKSMLASVAIEFSYLPRLVTTGLGVPLWPRSCYTVLRELCCMPSASMSSTTRLWKPLWSLWDSSTLPTVLLTNSMMLRLLTLTCQARYLFMVTEWWLLGEPPPWARRSPFSSLVIPSVEITSNHDRHTTISTTWMAPWSSSAASLFLWGYMCELQSTTSTSVQLYMSSMCGELSIWHSPWPCMADLFLISTAVSCTCMSFTLLVENTMAELGEDDVLSDEVRTDSWKPPWLFMISRPLPYFMCTTTETLPPKPPWALMFLALSLAAACLQPHQVQLGLRGEGALQEMLYWPPGVGEDRFLSCMVFLMSLCTLAQVNNMATRDMSDRSVLHEMAPAELTSLQLFSSSTELSSSSAVLSMKVTSKIPAASP